MEKLKIPMLSRFDTISHIMPYYGQTHRAFLLLSGLCSKTRSKLDEFYDEFVNLMKEHWRYIEIYSTRQNIPPNDLFEMSIDLSDHKVFNSFIEFIENLRDSEGWYFDSHWMHSKVKIRDPIRVGIDYIKTLYPYVGVLKSIQVVLCKEDIHNSKVEYESGTLDTNSNYDFV